MNVRLPAFATVVLLAATLAACDRQSAQTREATDKARESAAKAGEALKDAAKATAAAAQDAAKATVNAAKDASQQASEAASGIRGSWASSRGPTCSAMRSWASNAALWLRIAASGTTVATCDDASASSSAAWNPYSRNRYKR